LALKVCQIGSQQLAVTLNIAAMCSKQRDRLLKHLVLPYTCSKMHYYKIGIEMRAASPLGRALIGPLLNIRGERFNFATLEDSNGFRAGRTILLAECHPIVTANRSQGELKLAGRGATSPEKVT
jgi:hypothetical protein